MGFATQYWLVWDQESQQYYGSNKKPPSGSVATKLPESQAFGVYKDYFREFTPSTPMAGSGSPGASTEPVDTDAAIAEGASGAGFNPAHDEDAPLGPGFDYTPKASENLMTSTPKSWTSSPTPQPYQYTPKQKKKKERPLGSYEDWKAGKSPWIYGEAPAYGSPGYDGPLEPWKERSSRTAPRRTAPRRATRRF